MNIVKRSVKNEIYLKLAFHRPKNPKASARLWRTRKNKNAQKAHQSQQHQNEQWTNSTWNRHLYHRYVIRFFFEIHKIYVPAEQNGCGQRTIATWKPMAFHVKFSTAVKKNPFALHAHRSAIIKYSKRKTFAWTENRLSFFMSSAWLRYNERWKNFFEQKIMLRLLPAFWWFFFLIVSKVRKTFGDV